MDISKDKELACQAAEKNKALFARIADYIHENPELGMEEYKASDLLKTILSQKRFEISNPSEAMFPTAFTAVKGNGKIRIGFLAEYDALPELGHGCGHNLIAAMSTLAAIVTAEIFGDRATVSLFGCPAEETIGSKITFAEMGYFDGFDAVLICHPSDVTAVGGTSYATHPLQITFIGKPAHVADPEYHGINALDALVDFYGKLSELEKSFSEPYILGKIITEGGTAPNIIPDKAVLRATVRALSTDYLENHMLPLIKKLAYEISQKHGTELELYHYEPLFKNLVNDKTLNEYMKNNFSLLGLICVKEYPDDYADGSTDVGSVSYAAPTIQPEIQIGNCVSAHTEEFAQAAGSEYGKDMALKAAKALIMTAIDVIYRNVN